MEFIDALINVLELDHPRVGAAAARLPRRPLFRAGRRLRHRAGRQDARRRLRRRRGSRRLPARPGSASSWPCWSRSGFALVHGFASITHRGNQIVSGVAINFIAAGSTIILGQAWFQQGGRTPSLPAEDRFGAIALPFADALRDVPVIGQLYSGLLSGHSLLVYLAFLAVPFTWWVLFRTRFGLQAARGRREPGGRRYRRHLGRLAALPRRHLHRRPHRPRRLLPGAVAERRLRQGHDRRPRLHRARRAHLRQMEAGAGDVRLPAVRLPRRAVDPPAGHAAAADRQGARCS